MQGFIEVRKERRNGGGFGRILIAVSKIICVFDEGEHAFIEVQNGNRSSKIYGYLTLDSYDDVMEKIAEATK